MKLDDRSTRELAEVGIGIWRHLLGLGEEPSD
jgi:hypothetical protein